MFAVCVDLTIKEGHLENFLPLMQENAKASVEQEDGCRQFDVVQLGEDPHQIVLYETYDTAEAFQIHLKTDHFLKFDAATQTMIAEKSVRTGNVISG